MSEVTLLDAPKPPKLYPKQHAAINDPARIVVIDASTKAGKTVGCLRWQYIHAINSPNGKCLWVAPVYETAKKVGYERLCKLMRGCDPGQTVWTPRESELEVRFKNGACIRFKGSDNPDSIYGEDYVCAVIDEASRCKEAAWHAVRSTLTKTRGPVRIIGNVKGRKNWAYQLGQKARSGTEGMAYHKLTAYDAVEGGIMAPEEIEDAKRVLPDAVFRELYLAEPSDDGGNPFDLRAIAACVKPMSTLPPVCFGLDVAKSQDWMVLIGLDKNGDVCAFQRWQGSWENSYPRIWQHVGKVPVLVDSTGVGSPVVERLQTLGLRAEGYVFSQASKQQLMMGLASAIQCKQTSVLEGVHRDELESFEFEYTATGVRYSAPEGLHDDCVCAHALAVQHRAKAARTQFGFSIA